MGDEQRGLARSHIVVFQINIVFRQRVQGRRGLVENQNGTVLVEGPGQHQPLGLAAGEENAVQKHLPAHVGLRALGQLRHCLGQTGLVDAGIYTRIAVFWAIFSAMVTLRMENSWNTAEKRP